MELKLILNRIQKGQYVYGHSTWTVRRDLWTARWFMIRFYTNVSIDLLMELKLILNRIQKGQYVYGRLRIVEAFLS